MIQEFHAKSGKGVGQFGDHLVLLTTTGARSGEGRTTPVMFHRDGERLIVIASKAGAPDHPAWYHNLMANPLARVEIGTEAGVATLDVKAHEALGAERERIWADRVAMAPGFGEYQKKTPRRIPVMVLESVGKD
ncbi:MAG: nitroreductase family deazaflavin-dependent oxidoreductase [Candidatus Dormibacteraceae bacterium]